VAYTRWVAALSLSLSIASCGGRASIERTSELDEIGSERCDSDCECPDAAPVEGDSCPRAGLECSYRPFFCWDGRATCSAEGTWLLIQRAAVVCPSELPQRYTLCEGMGACSYSLNAGCGEVTLQAKCGCLDASWIWDTPQLPELCACSALPSRAACTLYPSYCSWSDEGRCDSR
jgi:hypothetical protein